MVTPQKCGYRNSASASQWTVSILFRPLPACINACSFVAHTLFCVTSVLVLLQQNKGGGVAGLVDRKGGAAGHSRYLCTICGVNAPSLTSMKVNGSEQLSSNSDIFLCFSCRDRENA